MLAALILSGISLAQTPVEGGAAGTHPVTDEREGGPFGLGMAIGAPSGLTGRLWFGDWSAAQFSAGGDLGAFNSAALTADYVVVFRPFEVTDSAYAIPLHIGGGINLDLASQSGVSTVLLGPRAVFGASLMVPELPIDFYAELAPTIYFIEYIGWSIDGQIGVRQYF